MIPILKPIFMNKYINPRTTLIIAINPKSDFSKKRVKTEILIIDTPTITNLLIDIHLTPDIDLSFSDILK